MKEPKVTINETIVRMLSETKRLGYAETSIWKTFFKVQADCSLL